MRHKQSSLLIGAHMSISGGFYKAIERGESIGCTAIQIFTKSNRQWYAKPISTEEIEKFATAWNNSSIESIIAHASYLINIGAPDPTIHKKSIDALIIEIDRCQQLKIPGLVLHPGSHGNTNEENTLNLISKTLDEVFEQVPGKSMILLETMAGQGSTVCYTFEQIEYLISQSNHKKRLGVCLDTCHVFAAGYDLRDKDSYTALWQKFDSIIGIDKLKAIHLNDSKKDLGSHVDRHEEIGQGKIGREAFKLLCTDRRFVEIPKILETPRDTLDDYLRNLMLIKEMIKK